MQLLRKRERDDSGGSASWLRQEVIRKDQAIDAAIAALTQLSKTGSITRVLRESTLRKLMEARNERLF